MFKKIVTYSWNERRLSSSLSKNLTRLKASDSVIEQTWWSLRKLLSSQLVIDPLLSLSILSKRARGAKSLMLHNLQRELSRTLSPSPTATSKFLSLFSDSYPSIMFYRNMNVISLYAQKRKVFLCINKILKMVHTFLWDQFLFVKIKLLN